MSMRILFVDDEPAVLSGITRMIRASQPDWEIESATSGEEALRILTRYEADVVVSDLRMPKLTGDQLLEAVRRRYPGVIRIMLSGHASEKASLRSIGSAQRFLSKPCQPETLLRAIAQSEVLKGLVAEPALTDLVGETTSLPAAPSLYIKLLKALEDSDCSIDQVAAIVERDVAMAAKVLHLVNSSFFGLARAISSPKQACIVLGMDTLASVVAMADAFGSLGSTEIHGLSVEELQSHSMTVGSLSRRFASMREETAHLAEQAMLAGLLHDAGKLLLAQRRPEYRLLLGGSRDGNVPVFEAEHEWWGATHAEVGAYLLGLWGLPDEIVEAVAFHHHPAEAPTQGFNLACCVHLADAMCRRGAEAPMCETACQLMNRYGLNAPEAIVAA